MVIKNDNNKTTNNTDQDKFIQNCISSRYGPVSEPKQALNKTMLKRRPSCRYFCGIYNQVRCSICENSKIQCSACFIESKNFNKS